MYGAGRFSITKNSYFCSAIVIDPRKILRGKSLVFINSPKPKQSRKKVGNSLDWVVFLTHTKTTNFDVKRWSKKIQIVPISAGSLQIVIDRQRQNVSPLQHPPPPLVRCSSEK
jgi:hypothetical protein